MLDDSRSHMEMAMSYLDNITFQDPKNTTDDEPQQQQSMALLILKTLNKYYIPVIIGIGIVGNVLSALVFLFTQLRRRSSSYYLAALAISDLVYLVILSLNYIDSLDVVRINSLNVFCQCMIYVSSVASFLSTWLIVSFTVERFIAVQYPLHRPHICTVRRAKLTVLGLAVAALVSQSYYLFMADVRHIGDLSFCGIRHGYEDKMSILNTVDTIVVNILPVLLIVIMNTMIAVQLYHFSRMYESPESVRRSKKAIEDIVQNPTGFSMLQSVSAHKHSHQKRPNEDDAMVMHYIQQDTGNRSNMARNGLQKCSLYSSNASTRSKTLSHEMQHNITKMLLIISTIFIVLNCPSYMIRVYGFMCEGDSIKLVQDYFMLMFYTNFSVNFLLYSTYGLTFRHALCALLYDKMVCHCLKQQKVRFTMYKCIHAIRAGQSTP